MRLLPVPVHLEEGIHVTLCKTWHHVISKTFNNLKQANKCQQILQNLVPLQQSLQDVPEIYFMHSTNFCFFLISICQGLGSIHLRYVSDIVLRHEAQGIKDMQQG